jgi:IS30 family transposase
LSIYQTLFVQAKGELRAEVKAALRSGRVQRRSRSRLRAAANAGQIKDMVLISDRPAEAGDRAVPGFWERDLIIGKDRVSQIATLVERTPKPNSTRSPTNSTTDHARHSAGANPPTYSTNSY